jgi:glycosidase
MNKEFHISRAARERYDFDQSIYQFTGNAVLADLQAVRAFAQRMNERRRAARNPHLAVYAGDLHAMGLIDEISHLVVQLYDQAMRERRLIAADQRMFAGALDYAVRVLGAPAVREALTQFVERFPPLPVYRNQMSPVAYVANYGADALEELVMLWLENENPAFGPFNELFDHAPLVERTAYLQLIEAVRAFFEQQPPFGPDNQPLLEMLQAPAKAAPGSLVGQLTFIRERWAPYFGEAFRRFLDRILLSFDLIREDEKRAFGIGGPGPAVVPTLADLSGASARPSGLVPLAEYEAYTADTDWMPHLVLLAKNTYVWLDQLSRKYQRAITRLDQVPDEELEQMARWGFTGLWLIGLWERSRASRRIKQIMGDHEAIASAYSIYDYVIAEDLGGPAALEALKARAWRYGIRLASDMVPNHMGIDSRWVIERPDYFLSLSYPPFPSYTFNGPDLSDDPRVGIFLEDHYYTRSDAAVVFKWVDRQTGEVRYIYHGNDGTSYPWNDTAQINYLNPEAREAVIQTIIRVARQFPIIRFDAAMTLVKRHIHRLWFPAPGEGGAIPSRAGLGMSAEAFDQLMPNEFWREVVDRVAVEAPGTLLLAEAFWLLEGYFVRTLGMHRVYNSAFMHMLRDEKNADYRQLIKNTLAFDPEILRRYVNFQNNPDEKTAIEQFGKGDKYFGVCVMMSTMPGLPMFGHGQIEGYTEKYGMEFRYPKLWEWPDQALVARHEREIFPLLRRRYLFAGVERFRLFDCVTAEGWVNEDVFAYTNAYGDERALVLYHNKFATANGRIHWSVPYVVKQGSEKITVRETLAQALGLRDDPSYYTIFRDAISGLECIRSNRELHSAGLEVTLNAYEYHVFDHIYEVVDDAEHPYAELCNELGGRWVASIADELMIVRMKPVTRAYQKLVEPARLRRLLDTADDPTLAADLADLAADGEALYAAMQSHILGAPDAARCALLGQATRDDMQQVLALRREGCFLLDKVTTAALLGWACARRLGEAAPAFQSSAEDAGQASRAWLTQRRLGDHLQAALQALGLDAHEAWQAVMQVKLVLGHHWPLADNTEADLSALGGLFADPDAIALLGIHDYNGITYFNKEAFESLMATWCAASCLTQGGDQLIWRARQQMMTEAAARAGYTLVGLMAALGQPAV